jgi:transforming growth factor-beta-induced protein
MSTKSFLRWAAAAVAALAIVGCAVTPPAQLQTIAEIAAADGRFDTLVAALDAADLADTFADPAAGPFTVFAPTDDAFATLLEDLDMTAEELLAMDGLLDILLYHVVSGELRAADVVAAAPTDVETLLDGASISVEVVDGGVVLDGTVNVIVTDVLASNGVIHAIDAVLLPPMDPDPLPTIAEIAAADEDFSILVAALDAAGFVGSFADPDAGPFTVFAPTNAAFEDLLEALELTAEELLALEELPDILLYHVLDGAFLAADVIAAAPFSVETLLTGAEIDVTVDDGVVLNGTINVIAADVLASNGVIHVIDGVLLPPAE